MPKCSNFWPTTTKQCMLSAHSYQPHHPNSMQYRALSHLPTKHNIHQFWERIRLSNIWWTRRWTILFLARSSFPSYQIFYSTKLFVFVLSVLWAGCFCFSPVSPFCFCNSLCPSVTMSFLPPSSIFHFLSAVCFEWFLKSKASWTTYGGRSRAMRIVCFRFEVRLMLTWQEANGVGGEKRGHG